jgi:single-stranded DNA-binding protein
VAVRIELCGRLIKPPALRVTPAGVAVAHLIVDCGERPGELAMAVVLTGEEARILAATLKDGQLVNVRGVLRVLSGTNREGGLRTSRLEVFAREVTAAGGEAGN